jgi:hypothetical protein
MGLAQEQEHALIIIIIARGRAVAIAIVGGTAVIAIVEKSYNRPCHPTENEESTQRARVAVVLAFISFIAFSSVVTSPRAVSVPGVNEAQQQQQRQ